MPFNELLPIVDRLSHQDKLRLIHTLLLAVAKEDGCNLGATSDDNPEHALLKQLAAIPAIVWSPQTDQAAIQALSDLLVAAKEDNNA